MGRFLVLVIPENRGFKKLIRRTWFKGGFCQTSRNHGFKPVRVLETHDVFAGPFPCLWSISKVLKFGIRYMYIHVGIQVENSNLLWNPGDPKKKNALQTEEVWKKCVRLFHVTCLKQIVQPTLKI